MGRGDATYIRIQNQVDVLIDAGPNSLITSCLGKHMPFYDRTIEYAILTNVKKSEYSGYSFLARRYDISHLFVSSPNKVPASYIRLLKQLTYKGTQIHTVVDHEEMHLVDAIMTIETDLKRSDETNISMLEPRLTVSLREYDSKVEVIGYNQTHQADSLLQQDPVRRLFIKIPEYGLPVGTLTRFLGLAEHATLLINNTQITPDHLQTLNTYSNLSVINMASGNDIVYRL
ncbi:hypothetical protein HYS00_02195 [Candidatus Microgenomates bacterium]|nr:hypothetical protein [Candidatus Microgenomates bacterium]